MPIDDPLIGRVYGTVRAGKPTLPALDLDSIRGYPVRIEDDSLDDLGIFHGDRVLVYSWMLDIWAEVEYINRVILMTAGDRLHFGRYRPPHLVQSYGRAHRVEGMEIAGIVGAVVKSEGRGKFE